MDLLPAAYEKRFSSRRFVGEARDFSLAADFESFFRHHQGMYDGMVGALKETLERHAHLEWLPTFFGMDLGADAIVVPTVLTGGNHYGPRVEAADGRACLYCILGFQVDKNDKPICPEDAVALVVHELCHSYVNQMIDRHSAIMKAPCERVAPFVGEAFKRSYGTKWNVMIYESLVRACTVRYVATFDGSDAAAILIEADRRLGLSWTAELSDLLCKYQDQRDVFPTLDAFVPQIASFFREYDPGRLRSSIEPVTR